MSNSKVTGQPWSSLDHVQWLLEKGWKPTRWEKDGMVTEYPVEGGIRAFGPDGTLRQEWSPDGVLSLYGVDRATIRDSTGASITLVRPATSDG